MPQYVQWMIVSVIGVVAVWFVARYFGLGSRKAGCPGCNSCESKVGAKPASPNPSK